MANSRAAFTVIQFSLDAGANGLPVQRTRMCGSFESIEEAFAAARSQAAQAWSQLTNAVAGATEPPSLVDTEWGYDLRLGALTVERIWVHDHRPAVKA